MKSSKNFLNIKIWEKLVAKILFDIDKNTYRITHNPLFFSSNLNLFPILMNKKEKNFDDIFNKHANTTFFLKLFSDSIPDGFGLKIFQSYCYAKNISFDQMDFIDKIYYIGKRGIGALEFFSQNDTNNYSFELMIDTPIIMKDIIQTLQIILDKGKSINLEFNKNHLQKKLLTVFSICTTAGGMRPKAVIAQNKSGEIFSEFSDYANNCDFWIMKLDGIKDNRFGSPKNFAKIEFAYYLMALEAGIRMPECKLHEENGRFHFMSKRFDRQNGKKIHSQTLYNIAGYDNNKPGKYSYEQCFDIIKNLNISYKDRKEFFKRMVFNVIARNQDDHTKNISFLMDNDGSWKLSPAYDITFSYSLSNKWTRYHQMSINGKLDNFSISDITSIGELNEIENPKKIVLNIVDVVKRWDHFAKKVKLEQYKMEKIKQSHRTNIID